MIVQKLPKELSEGAKRLYSIALNNYNGTIQRAEDWERKHYTRNGYITADKAFIGELVEAGLATSRVHNFSGEDHTYLWVTPIYPEYSHISDGGEEPRGMYAEISLLGMPGHEEILLLTMMGVSLYKNDGNGRYKMPSWRLTVRHNEATDFEHSSAYIADLTLMNPVVDSISERGTTLVGTLSEVAYYPYRSDLTTEESDVCDGSKYCNRGKQHPITSFSPPENEDQKDLVGSMVKVVLTPRSLVDQTTGAFISSDVEEG